MAQCVTHSRGAGKVGWKVLWNEKCCRKVLWNEKCCRKVLWKSDVAWKVLWNKKCCRMKPRERVCARQPMGKPSRQHEEELRGRNIKEEEWAGGHLFCFHTETKMELFGAKNGSRKEMVGEQALASQKQKQVSILWVTQFSNLLLKIAGNGCL